MYVSGDDTERFARQVSAKTWVAMCRNSGRQRAYFGPANAAKFGAGAQYLDARIPQMATGHVGLGRWPHRERAEPVRRH
jgi:hypothetical protein